MLRSAHSSWSADPRYFRWAKLAVVLVSLACAPAQQSDLVREGDRFRRDFYGSHPAARRLRVNAHGPVTLQAGGGNAVSYQVSVRVRARSEAEARRVLERYVVRTETVGDRVVITAPGGPVISTVTVRAPRLEGAVISTSDGAVD